MILFNPSVIFEVSILPVALPNLNIFLKSRRLFAKSRFGLAGRLAPGTALRLLVMAPAMPRRRALCRDQSAPASIEPAKPNLLWPISLPLLKAIDALADMIKFNVRFAVCSRGKSVEDKSTPAQEKPARQWINSLKRQFRFPWKRRCARATWITQ
jgi:hypothetical protein